jgi:hypothetical protein
MAMTGMRVMTTQLGLLEQTPPQAISRQRARGLRALLRRAPPRQRTGLVEAAHWAFGASGGAAFGALPRAVRRRRWAGPIYGLVVWLGFELGIAPALGLSQSKRLRVVDRLALAADHLLYGVVLSVPRRTERGQQGTHRRRNVESEKREAEETHPGEPSGNGETQSEPYEPERDDPIPEESTESKRAEDPDDRAQKATDDGMPKRTQRGP